MRARRTLLAAATLACFFVVTTGAGPAGAEDDGGVASVFAYGAGTRALAMGGAFTTPPPMLRVTLVETFRADKASRTIGFRCVRAVSASP